jgi:chromosomal replication initiator protein
MNTEELWTKLISQLKSKSTVNASQIDAFFSRLTVQVASLGFVMFTTDNEFIRNWIQSHYMKDIQEALKELYDCDWFVQIEIDTTGGSTSNANQADTDAKKTDRANNHTADISEEGRGNFTHTNGNAAVSRNKSDSKTAEIRSSGEVAYAEAADVEVTASEVSTTEVASTNGAPAIKSIGSNLTFDSFVVGPSNQMAYSMATAVAERPGGTTMNPLFIYGRSGVGKTHLLCAIHNYIREQYPQLNVLYIDSMQLVNEYSNAAMEKDFVGFERRFEELDVLLLDDIQSLRGKQGTLDTLFRIFNSQIGKGKQFVFSADRAPKNIDLDERYVSRFNSGATIDIQPPDTETKLNIIKRIIKECQQEENFDIDISDDIITFIAEHSSSNVRELKSAITGVVFALKIDPNHALTKQKARELLSNHFTSGKVNRITIESIQHAVSDFYGIPLVEMVGKARNKNIKNPRQVAIYLCREMTDKTLKQIGEEFNRTHATIMHSCDLIAKNLEEDRNLREEIEAIREKINTQEY